MHDVPPNVKRGTLGELLAQVHLLANGVQAAPPLRDSGNDLIACRGKSILGLQVKTAKRHNFSKRRLPRLYHAAVFVVLKENDDGYCDVHKAVIYLMSRSEIESAASLGKKGLEPFQISPERVKSVFRNALGPSVQRRQQRRQEPVKEVASESCTKVPGTINREPRKES